MIGKLLKCETVLTFPFFILAWVTSAVIHACKAGWHVAKMGEKDKQAMLEQYCGALTSEKKETNESV